MRNIFRLKKGVSIILKIDWAVELYKVNFINLFSIFERFSIIAFFSATLISLIFILLEQENK